MVWSRGMLPAPALQNTPALLPFPGVGGCATHAHRAVALGLAVSF